MIRLLSNSKSQISDQVIKAVIYGKHDSATLKRIDQAFKRAGLVRRDLNMFNIPPGLKDVPFAERDLLHVKVIGEKGKCGIAKYDDFEIHIPGVKVGEELEVIITRCYPTYADASIAAPPSIEND